LAHNDCACRAQLGNCSGILAAATARTDRRSPLGGVIRRIEDVLDGDWNAEQRTHGAAFRPTLLKRTRLRQRMFAVESREGSDVGVHAFNAVDAGAAIFFD